jgi:hypothetical protein
MPFAGIDPATIQAARAAALARGMPQPVAAMPNAAVPPPVPPRVPPPMVNRAAMGDMEAPVSNSPGKAALGEVPQQEFEPVDEAAYAEDLPDPRTTAKHTSFFDRPGATDALTAFGAAMLKAPTFLQGLGDAALAVNAVERENRMPTEEEIARANMKYRISRGLDPSGKRTYSPKPLDSGYDQRGVYWTGIANGDGTQTWTSDEGEELSHPPEGFERGADSGRAQRGKDEEKYVTKARDTHDVAWKNMPIYSSIFENLGSVGAGSSFWDRGVRAIASALGTDIGDVDVSDKEVFEKQVRELELQKAQTQRGLGQFTEMERKIVQQSLPSLDTQTESVLRVTMQMKVRDQIDIELYEEWMNTPPKERGSFEQFAFKFYTKFRENEGALYKQKYEQMFKAELERNPSLKQFTKSGGKKAPASSSSGSSAIPKEYEKYFVD